MGVKLMGFPSHLGAPSRASGNGPTALRSAGLLHHVQDIHPEAACLGDVAVPALFPGESLLQQVFRAAKRQIAAVTAQVTTADTLITIGGDHSTSLGSITALHQLGHDFDVVWIDAHPDFNRPDTSPSGLPHGMVLAALAGLVPGWERVVDPTRIWVLGARDIDPGERVALGQAGAHVFGVAETQAELPTLLAELGPQVFVSFDLDSADPSAAPGVGTPVPGGFTRAQALNLVRSIAGSTRVVGLDVVELKPETDPDGRTARLAIDVVCGVLASRLSAPPSPEVSAHLSPQPWSEHSRVDPNP